MDTKEAALSRNVRRRRKKARERPSIVARQVEALPPAPGLFVLKMRLSACLVAVAFFAGAWFGLDYGLGVRNLARDSKTWPIASGVVLTAEVTEDGGRRTTYKPHVTYAYTVNGASYVGHVVRAGDSGSRVGAEVLLGQLPSGSIVTVHYDPGEPSRAVLEPGGGELWWLFAGAGAMSGLVGLILLIRTARDEWLRLTYERAERRQALAAPDSP